MRIAAWLLIYAVLFSANCSPVKPNSKLKKSVLDQKGTHSNMDQNQAITMRATRHVAIYQGTQLVLLAEDKPGHLISTAAPNPNGLVKHPFINAKATWAPAEHQIGGILNQCNSFDNFLETLIENDFNVFSTEQGTAPDEIEGGFRIHEGEALIGAVNSHPGQFMTLKAQAIEGQNQSEVATMTVYEAEKALQLFSALEGAGSLEELVSRVENLSFEIGEL